MMDFQKQLFDCVKAAFDNEQAFIKRFYPEVDSPDEYKLDSFYMAGERCRVLMKSVLVGTYLVAPDTIKTTEYLDWYENYKENQ